MDRPNVVWITLDSVRADHTSVHGYRRETTPNLERLASRTSATAFDHCFSHAMSTRPSTASILTGTHPSHHQTWGHTELTDVYALPDELTTAPELFSRAGYRTVGVSRNSHFSPGTELDRGFDEFSFIIPSTLRETVGFRGLVRYLFNLRQHSAGFTSDRDKLGTAFFVNCVLKRKIDELADGDEPFFLYAHYNEPHTAYHPPLPYLDAFTDKIAVDTETAVAKSMEMHKSLIPTSRPHTFSEPELDGIEAMYDGEIAYTDAMLGEVFDWLSRSTRDDTVVVVTSDHGDLFGELGLVGHMHCLHDGLTNVPLVIDGLDSVDHQSGRLVQHADVMKTLLLVAGADTGRFGGIDLRSETREHVVSQRSPQRDAPDPFHDPMVTAIRTPDFKYQQSMAGSELYTLPDEETDRTSAYPGVANRLEERVDTLLNGEGEPVTDEKAGSLTPEMEAHLRDMGYIQ